MLKRAFAAILVLAGVVPVFAANRGAEVIVVYNTRVPESKSIAEYYAERRHVPASQIFGFALNTGEEMSRTEFTDSLEKPLARKLEAKKLWRTGTETLPATNGHPAKVIRRVTESKIRYAVLCYGVPVKIARDPNLPDPQRDKIRPEFRRNEAAVDSELSLLPSLDEDLPLDGPLTNPLYGLTNAVAFTPTNGVLMVARLDGPSAKIARGLVDKAIEAETNGLWGRAYFDARNIQDPAYKLGDEWIEEAAKMCRELGFETTVDEKPATFPPEFPMSHIAIYCGWYAGNADGPFARKHVEFMPGAFAYHLHSFSAAHLRSATDNWVGPLLARGATITMGCVYEPYLGGTPDVSIFISRFIHFGFTFGEAAYACQSVLSWQTTVVGDPLYQPFGIPPLERLKELVARRSKYLEWSHLKVVDLNIGRETPLPIVVNYLETIPTTKHSAVLTEKLAGLYETMGKPSSAIETYQKALTLDPSPEQAIRIRLTLADKLLEAKDDAAAYDDLKNLLSENPDYPAKENIYKRMEPLAEKLNKKEDLAKLEGELQPKGPAAVKN